MLLLPFELYFRDNTYKAKAEVLEEKSEFVTTLFLGSSHVWRAINPEWYDENSISLAIGGSAIDIDYLLFNKFVDDLPNLKTLVLEISYHTLEERRGKNWPKNFLLYKYFKINNYNNGIVPWQDHFLLTSQPIFYFKKLLFQRNKIENGKYNEYGFIITPPEISDDYSSRFASLSYDQNKIDSSSNTVLNSLHTNLNIENYKASTDQILRMAKYCESKNIDFIILSTPKYKTYNLMMNAEKEGRRQKFLKELINDYDLQVLNFDRLYENNVKYFINENHLSVEGAKHFSSFLKEKVKGGKNYLP